MSMVARGWALALVGVLLVAGWSGRPAHAGDTTVVISVSIGGGVAIGMAAWFLHITFSERIARMDREPKPEEPAGLLGGLSGPAAPGRAADPWFDRGIPPEEAVTPPPGVHDPGVRVRFLNVSW